MLSYLEELTIQLAIGVSELPQGDRQRHIDYLQGCQQPDGGFGGREGGSDLYYTGFALRSLAILGVLDGGLAERAAHFLRQRLTGKESVVDFLSLIYGAALLESSAGIDVFDNVSSDWRSDVAAYIERLRRDDGGYAKGEEGAISSTYHTFLVLICLQLLERPIPEPEGILSFIRSQHDPEGGFREIRASKRAGTNPTAAAIGVLRTLDALDPQTCEETIDFLADMQTDEGGLRANTRIPIADLLSTFTGAWTLITVGGLEEIDVTEALRYAQRMQLESGGFRGAEWDPAHDVEYTFYGLGCLAVLRPPAPERNAEEQQTDS